jgi:2-isopropylmalate synthase
VSLARCVKSDIDLAIQSLAKAKANSRVHVFVGTSEELMNYSIKKREAEVLNMINESIRYTRENFPGEIQFSPEDASRTEPEFMYKAIEEAISAGATTINVPDTVGYSQPREFYSRIKGIFENVKNISNTIISVHCHDDLGLSTANSLEGVIAGARQIEGTLIGIGERAGNTNLCQVVMELKSRKDFYTNMIGEYDLNVDTTKFGLIADYISEVSEMPLALCDPVIGKNAFRDSSGIHANAVLTKKSTYHIIEPQEVGRNIEIVIGPTSGTNIVKRFLTNNSYTAKDEDVKIITEIMKTYASRINGCLTETESIVLTKEYFNEIQKEKAISLDSIKITTGNVIGHYAESTVNVSGKIRVGKSFGVGTVDASINSMLDAMNGYLKEPISLSHFELIPVGKGSTAEAKCMVAFDYDGKRYWGRGRDKDIALAPVYATVDALDSIYRLNRL